MNVLASPLAGTLLLEARVFTDLRGRFLEVWRAEDYLALGLGPFVQDNVSVSDRGVLRGLHLQNPAPQGKLVTVLAGEAFDVAVDLRPGSPAFGRWAGVELSAENGRQFYLPPGFAHGFQALRDGTVVSYKCTEYYVAAAELTVRWNDPEIGIAWPIAGPVLSPKDALAPLLGGIPLDRLLPFESCLR